MGSNDIWVLTAMVIYFAIVLGIGFFYAKKSRCSQNKAAILTGLVIFLTPRESYNEGEVTACWN